MLRRSAILGLLAISFLFGFNGNAAKALTVDTSLSATMRLHADVTKVRWVCGPYRCAWIPRYRGRVVVYPHMRGWVRPPSPHCIYVRHLFTWRRVCP